MSKKLTRTIELLVNGGIDTKSNPKLVRSPALLELENMYQLRTGELRPRNGFSAFTFVGISGGIHGTVQGGVGTVTTNSGYPSVRRLSSSGAVGAIGAGGPLYVHPLVTAAVTGVRERYSENADQSEPDLALLSSGARAVTWVDSSSGGSPGYVDWRDVATGTERNYFQGQGPIASGRPFVCVGTGTTVALFYVDTTASPSVVSCLTETLTPSTLTLLHAKASIITDLSQAQPWFDAKVIPGGSNVAIAWRANAGGIKCAILNLTTLAVTSTVTTAGADASMTLGWLDDQLSTGNMFLATAGSTSGVVVRTMSAAAMVVSATNAIDAAATANVRNVTGHTVGGSADYAVFWDVSSAASTVYDKIRLGRWNGAATLYDFAAHHTLYSRSVMFPDGQYYVLGSLASTVQPHFALYPATDVDVNGGPGAARTPLPMCYALSGEGGGRRNQCSLTTPVLYKGAVYMAVARKRQIQTPVSGSPGAQSAQIYQLAFSQIAKVKSRELGGSVFLPGGMPLIDDGNTTRPATFPIYPETPTLTQAAGGALTALGTYLYRVVFKMTDGAGRVYRSAGSVTASITLTGANATVNVALFNLKEVPTYGGFSVAFVCEVYRRGPTASGATLYSKVGEAAVGSLTTDTVTFVDTMNDTTAALGEVAYFNGNVLENLSPPSAALLEVNGNRVGIVNAEDPTEFWYSKEYKAGVGIGFYPDFKVRISGDGAGGMTALAAMDGRWVLFKRSAIYVLSGDGPNDLGQGSFNAPQALSRSLGTVNPSSVVETPDGIMFESPAGGIWLLNRGLGLEYVGAPVEQYTIAEDVAGAALVSTLTTVRFVMPSGRTLEWDYFHKRWYTHKLRVDASGVASTIVGCINSTLFGWCYLLASGWLMQEVAGQTNDVSGTTTTIVPRVSFPHLELAGLAGYQRFRRMDLVIDVLGTFTLSVDAEFNYSGAVTGAPKTLTLTAATPTAQVEYLPPDGSAKCASMRPVITLSGPALGGSFRLTGASIEISIKSGSNIPASGRMS